MNTDQICEKCGKVVLQENFWMLPSFTYSAIPVISKKVQRRDKYGKMRIVNTEHAIPFPAAFQVAARIPGSNPSKYLNPKSCQK
jgi:hypothetical protein